jgi:hypothetical protein
LVEHADDDKMCQNNSDAHFTFSAHGTFEGRRFTQNYFRKLKNGEKVEYCWLVYPMKVEALPCYRYKVFSPAQHQLRKDGFRAWQYIPKFLSSHEGRSIQMECMAKWKELEIRLKKMSTI